MKQWLIAVGLMMVLMSVLIGAGCQRASQEAPAQAPAGQTVTMVTKELAFEPREVRVKAGRVTFNVKNEGAVEHDFMITGVAEHQGDHGPVTFKPGETYTLTVDLTRGTYEIVCGVPGHKEAGMTATLVVEP